MNWESISAFFSMGGYAFYVWGSIGVTLFALLLEPLMLHRRRREILKSLQRELKLKKNPTP